MSCNVKQNSLNVLEAKGAINGDNIADITKFNDLNRALTDLAYDQYSIHDKNAMLFSISTELSIDDEGNTVKNNIVIPNDKLFATLDKEVNSNTKVTLDTTKKGVTEVFEENPELAEIGTEQEYSDYLDSVFPDSKEKTLFYHGSPTKNEKLLSPEDEGYKKQEITTTGIAGIYVTDTKKIADKYQDFENKGSIGYTHTLILDVKRPLIVGDKVTDGISENTFGMASLWNIQKGVVNGLRKAGIDAIKSGKYGSKNSALGENIEIAVFKSSQIHILGSKKDIQGFKDSKTASLTAEQTTIVSSDNNTIDLSNLEDNTKGSVFTHKGELSDLTNEEIEDLYTTAQIEDNDNVVKAPTSTPNEFLLFAGAELTNNTIPAVDVLQNLINYYAGTKNKYLLTLIKKAQELMQLTDATVEIGRESMFKENGKYTKFMVYSAANNTVYISLKQLNEASPAHITATILHEVVHALTVRAFVSPNNLSQEAFKDFITKEYYRYLKQFKQEGVYGFKNPLEFLSEAYSNKNFARELRLIDKANKDKKGFFGRLVAAIRRLLGLKKVEGYDKIIEAILAVGAEVQVYDHAKRKDYLDEFAMAVDTSKETDNTTKESKLANSLLKIEESINRTIKSLEKQKSFTAEEKKNSILIHINTFKKLREDVKEYQDLNAIGGIELFADAMIKNLQFIKTKLQSVDNTDEKYLSNALRRYKEIASVYGIVDYLQEVLADIANDTSSDEDVMQLNRVSAKLSEGQKEFSNISNDLHSKTKLYTILFLSDIKYWSEIKTKFRKRFENEYRLNKLKTDKTTWVAKQLARADVKEEMQEQVVISAKKLVNNPAIDISSASKLFNSSINISDTLIQIMNFMLSEIDIKRAEAIQLNDRKIEVAFKALAAEKNSTSINKLYADFYEQNEEGTYFFKGEYSIKFYDQVVKKIYALREEYLVKQEVITIEMAKVVYAGEAYMKLNSELIELREFYTKAEQAIETKEMNLIGDTLVPKDKWKTNKSKLGPAANKLLDLFITQSEEVKDLIKPGKNENSIIYAYGVKFYQFPKVTISDQERVLTGKLKGKFAAVGQDLSGYNPSDIGEVSDKQTADGNSKVVHTDMVGNKINKLRVWYRGKLDATRQSMDLSTIMRLDYINAVTYSERRKVEQELNFMVDVASQGKIYDKEGTVRNETTYGKYNTKSGANSNRTQMAANMLSSRFYDNMNKNNVKFNKVDVNKLVTYLNGGSAFLTLSLNIASGTANVLNANAQLFLESVLSSQSISAKSIAKANILYGKGLGGVMNDLYNPVNRGFVNQFGEYFNIRGLFNVGTVNFMQSSLLKKGLSTQSLQIAQSTGEHWLQSVTSMSVADGVKVMDANHNFIDKNGKIVKTKKEAASVLDMLYVNDAEILTMNSAVVYTSHSLVTKWDDGGKIEVYSLIRKKLYDVAGNYTEIDQPEVFRHSLGKLSMLYRKYLVPMGVSRFRGVMHSTKKYEDMTDEDLKYSYALQEYEEGTYTTLIQYLRNSLFTGKVSVQAMYGNWEQLSDYQRHNIKKVVVELIMTSVMLPLANMLIAAMAGDDDEWAYFLLYQLRRLDTELSQYRSISESIKMTRSPIPSMRIIGSGTDIIANTLKFWTWDDKIESGKDKGMNRYMRAVYKMTPGVKEWYRSFQDMYEYQNSNWGM